jgi:RES domain-containing protein
MLVFRMYAPHRDVFDSTGAFLNAGRWHSAGTRVIYAAEHASLAVLETLIHAGGRKLPPRSLAQIEIPVRIAIESTAWLEMPHSQAFGDQWVRDARTAILRVPSVAVNGIESNLVVNPAHPDFRQIQLVRSNQFIFDPRFFLIPGPK